MVAAGSTSTIWCVSTSNMRRPGRFGWISKFFCKPRGRSFSAKAPTEAYPSCTRLSAFNQSLPVRNAPGTTPRSAIHPCLGEYSMATQIEPLRYNYLPGTRAELSKSLDGHTRPSPGNLVRVGVIGYGYWGPNVVRNLQGLENCQLVTICDKNSDSLQRASRVYPGVELTMDFSELLTSPQIDAVAVVTPVRTHFELAKAALQNGKHVFVEKPFTSTHQQAEELIELADRNRLKIMVDHTFLFSGAVRKIRELVDDGTLGDLYYFDSTRVNLGLFQHDVNVAWDLAPHDLSIMDHVIRAKPEAVVATGGRHLNGLADLAYITVYFPGNLFAHINVNWLSPVKVRKTLIGGEKKMLVWNDLEADEKIKVYDKGVQMTNGRGVYDL